MRIIIAGSRTATENQVFEALRRCPWINFASAIVSGMAKGADAFGEKWAAQQGIHVYRFDADWERLGKRAGPARNKEMAANAEGLVVVWDGESRGTRSMIDLAKRNGLQIFCLLTKTEMVIEIEPSGKVAGLWESAQERAAMMEFSSELSRAEAERRAGLAIVPPTSYHDIFPQPATTQGNVLERETESSKKRVVTKKPNE